MFCDKPFLEPRSFIEIEILKLPNGGAETFIGITKNLKQKSSKNNITLHLQSKYKNNTFLKEEEEKKNDEEITFKEGDRIGIMVNYKDLLCSFFKNGKECGIMGKLKENQIYFLVIHFFEKDEEYKFVNSKVFQ